MSEAVRPAAPGAPGAPGAPARVTLAAVATRAGVSVGTVSKALSGTGRMRPETRERVVEAAAELGFTPTAAAQQPHSGRTWTVGLITTDGIGRFSSPFLFGAEDALCAGQSLLRIA